MRQITPTALLPAACKAAEDACVLLRAEFHRLGGVRLCHGKPLIDIEVERLLHARLIAAHRCGFHGEETVHDPLGAGDVWVVDPLDGTADFVAGRRGAALSIALLRDSVPVLGVVASPVAPCDAGDMLAWAEGGPILRNGRPQPRRRVRALTLVGCNAGADAYAHHMARIVPDLRIVAAPSPARRLALTAAGDLDAAISLKTGLCSWDLAGGHALLRAAGLALTDRNGRPILHDGRHFNGALAGDPALVARLTRLPLEGRARPTGRNMPRRLCTDPLLLDRARGSLLGLLSGDALGSAVEFRTARGIADSHPDGVRNLTDGGTWDLSAGQPTDDGEMALALARSLVAQGGYDPQAVGAAYVGWFRSEPFDIGATTRAGIAALANGRRADSDSQANGALMRVAPLGIFAQGDPSRAAALARQDAGLTHPSPVCRAANAAFTAALAVGVAGGDTPAMLRAARDHAGDDAAGETVRARLTAAQDAPPPVFQRQMGWVLTALQNAFHQLVSNAPLETALIDTVSRGGDTDTNAAICGALLGARHGVIAIPHRWRKAVLTCRAAEGTRRPRPAVYWPDDAESLAEALLVGSATRG